MKTISWLLAAIALALNSFPASAGGYAVRQRSVQFSAGYSYGVQLQAAPVYYAAPPVQQFAAPQFAPSCQSCVAPPVQQQFAAPQVFQQAPQVQYQQAPVVFQAPQQVYYQAPAFVVRQRAPAYYQQPARQFFAPQRGFAVQRNAGYGGGAVFQQQAIQPGFQQQQAIQPGFQQQQSIQQSGGFFGRSRTVIQQQQGGY